MKTFKKNELVEVYIEDMSDSGEGIGHVAGMTFFVKNAVIGDYVEAGITKVKKTYCYARTNKVIRESEFRKNPTCSIYSPCGGCQLQQLSYEKQLEFKRKKVADCFRRIGGFKVSCDSEENTLTGTRESLSDESESLFINPVIGMENPANYRNKAQFPFGVGKDGAPVAGFYAGRTHSVIPTGYCGIEFPGHEEILSTIMEYVSAVGESVYDEKTGRGTLRHVLMRKGFATGEIMVVMVINADGLRDEILLAEKLKKIPGMTSIQVNINKDNTNVILGDACRTLYGSDYIVDKIGDVSFRISALSFYQVNPVQTVKLYRTAAEFAGLTGEETVWDLYCGIGTISLFLAKQAKKVYGVEIVPQAIEDAKRNAVLNGIENAEFFVGAAEDVYNEKKYPADVVVVDPPRKGIDESLVKGIAAMQPKRIVYVSCDPATLARDCKRFGEEGYKVLKVQPTDMFPETVHVECVILMSRKEK